MALPSIVISSFKYNEEYTRPVSRKRHIHVYPDLPKAVTANLAPGYLNPTRNESKHRKIIELKIMTDAAANW